MSHRELTPADRAADLTPAEQGARTAAVLAAMDRAAQEHLDENRPTKTKSGYARDWELWTEYHAWLAQQTGHVLPLTAVSKGTLVGFVVWLDQMKEAAPNTIDRRITGVTVTARHEGAEVPKEATAAAREALKPLKRDRARQARGRGKAVAATPDNLRAMNTAPTARPTPAVGKRRGTQELPALAVLRDRALATVAFGIGGRASEVSALTVGDITLEGKGLRIVVPSVKGRPERTVVVAYGENPETCPVRCWLAWKNTAGLTDGPAFRPVDQKGRVGAARLSPDGCRLAITRAAKRAGLKATLTGHSMRSGLVTTARQRGKRAEKIRQQTGHAENSPVFWGYVRDAELWDDPATEGIGL